MTLLIDMPLAIKTNSVNDFINKHDVKGGSQNYVVYTAMCKAAVEDSNASQNPKQTSSADKLMSATIEDDKHSESTGVCTVNKQQL